MTSINGDGYLITRDPSHPLATAQGKLLVHRAILYAMLGEGEHPCHWCNKMLTWRGRPSLRISTDHLDHNRLNNHPSNLVPSCLDCNTKRLAGPRKPRRPTGKRFTAEEQAEKARRRATAWYYANREYVLARLKAQRAVAKS